MTFRTRLLLACLPLALLPLLLFGLDVRREVADRMDAQHRERVDALAGVIEGDLARISETLGRQLDRLAEEIGADPDLRLALVRSAQADEGDRAYLRDYAPRAMPLAGLDALRIQAEDGTVLSSGHFRAEYDVRDLELLDALTDADAEGAAVLVELATPSGPMLVFARARPLAVGSEPVTLVGGVAADRALLDGMGRGTGLEVGLHLPGGDPAWIGTEPSGPGREVAVRFAPGGANRGAGEGAARIHVAASDEPLTLLQADLNRRLLLASLGVSALALLLAVLISAQLGRPLAQLARAAERVDLTGPDTGFPTDRRDEIGRLAQVLDRMTGRLRSETSRLREAERRAATGDLARQVHHDVRNGLIPIRNVLGHLTELAREEPDRLPGVFLERHRTLESSVAHLHDLAARYARLSPPLEREEIDVGRVVREAVGDAAGPAAPGGEGRARVEVDLADDLPSVVGDPAALRRVAANLVGNALEALDAVPEGHVPPGHVTVRARRTQVAGEARIRLTVADDGPGMTPDEHARAFDDFYSTKPGGTGLGLSIVRRLVSDLGGRVEIESAPGEGTRVTVELPASPASASPAPASSTPAGLAPASPATATPGEARS